MRNEWTPDLDSLGYYALLLAATASSHLKTICLEIVRIFFVFISLFKYFIVYVRAYNFIGDAFVVIAFRFFAIVFFSKYYFLAWFEVCLWLSVKQVLIWSFSPLRLCASCLSTHCHHHHHLHQSRHRTMPPTTSVVISVEPIKRIIKQQQQQKQMHYSWMSEWMVAAAADDDDWLLCPHTVWFGCHEWPLRMYW